VGLSLLIIILVGIAVLAGVVVWFIFKGESSPKQKKNSIDSLTEQAKEDVEHIFNDEFREELRNRGRLHFEKIIGENAMFLQQDLRLTTSQLNEFMKDEITNVLKEEFSKYEESINDAKELAIESIQKTQSTIEQQRELLTQQLTEQLAAEKSRSMTRFETHMADVVNHYVLEAVGDQIDLSEQLDFILAQLERNKEAIMRDISDGA
jgi:glutathionyl-hydroquinone reductase